MGISCRQFRFRRECLVIRPSAAEIAPQGHFLALRAQGATAPLGPRNDKSGSIAPLNSCHQYCQPAWRSLSAATDAIGAYRFHGGRYGASVPSRDCHALLRKARNDKSRAFTVLTIVCQFRRYSAGPGMPLPYNITLHCKRAGRAVRPFSIIISFSFSPGYRRCTCARRSPSTRHRCQNTGRSYCL